MTPEKKPNGKEKSNKIAPKEKEGKDFIAVRWPSTLRRDLKMAAAGHIPPLTMTEYLAKCFNEIQDRGFSTKSAGVSPRNNDKQQRKRYQEVGEKLFKTRDRRLIDCVILLLEYATR